MHDINCTDEEILEAVRAIDPVNNSAYEMDDKSNGMLFAEVFGGVARYNTTTRLYSVYDGIRWIIDNDNLVVEGLSQRLARILCHYAIDADRQEKQPYLTHYRKLGQYNTMRTMLLEARNFHSLSEEVFDQNKYLLNVRNGTIDLNTFEFRDHRAEDLLSCVANVEYDPVARCDNWERFVSEVTQHMCDDGTLQDDPDKAAYIRRICGYLLIGDCKEDEFYLFYGATTRNGKSTFLSVIGDILGDYAEMIEPDALSQGRKSSANDEQIADLRGKRFAHVEEPSKQMIFDTGLIKKLTGRSRLTASRKYEHRFSYMPEFKIILATNYLPTVLDDSLFKSSRCKVIPFEHHFTEEEQDKGLRSKLLAERSGILIWMIMGLDEYKQGGLNPCQSVIDATEEYRHTSDRIENFLQECTEEAPGEFCTLKQLYTRYTEWCNESGYSPEGKQKFSDSLKRRRMVIDHKKIKGVQFHNVIMNRKIIYDAPFEPANKGDSPFS